MKKNLLLAVFALVLNACAPTIETRGNIISDAKLKEVQVYVSSRAEVEQKWGPPSSVSTLDPNTWYYIGETSAQNGVFAPKVQKRRIVRVKFSPGDLVTEVTDMDTKLSRDIEPSERKTPTAGKEYTMFQQFIGNLGKFNSDKSKAR